MADEEHLKILKQGVEVWNRWREENPPVLWPDLADADLGEANLFRADLSSTFLVYANLSGADLRGANLSGADLSGAKLRGAHLSEANLGGAKLSRADLSRADLSEADLSAVDLSEAYLSAVDLSEAYLSRANLIGAKLNGANLRGAKLSRAILSRANLSGADLTGADLFNAYLDQVALPEADLSRAKLSRADLSRANLSEAKLRGANLSGADLSGADLRGANLSGADLSGAKLSRGRTSQTLFAYLDLRNVKGLETIKHIGPSTIGTDTIYRSQGKIPEAFLRGCGLSDLQVEMVKLHYSDLTSEQVTKITYKIHELCVTGAFHYYSCFISYSSKDNDFAERLHNDLQGKGVRCWFAPEDVQAGRRLYEQIDQAIRLHDKLLLVLSDSSIHSEWVMTEIRRARKAEIRDERRKLFPVSLADWQTIKDWECFDADLGKDLAVEVREYFVPDFSKWKDHDSYQGAFDRLLRDLKASEA